MGDILHMVSCCLFIWNRCHGLRLGPLMFLEFLEKVCPFSLSALSPDCCHSHSKIQLKGDTLHARGKGTGCLQCSIPSIFRQWFISKSISTPPSQKHCFPFLALMISRASSFWIHWVILIAFKKSVFPVDLSALVCVSNNTNIIQVKITCPCTISSCHPTLQLMTGLMGLFIMKII